MIDGPEMKSDLVKKLERTESIVDYQRARRES
jgi:uncharacterized protein (DUF2461 family)